MGAETMAGMGLRQTDAGVVSDGQRAYAPAPILTVSGPIRYQKTEGDPNLLLLKGKLQFSRLMNINPGPSKNVRLG